LTAIKNGDVRSVSDTEITRPGRARRGCGTSPTMYPGLSCRRPVTDPVAVRTIPAGFDRPAAPVGSRLRPAIVALIALALLPVAPFAGVTVG
jgi:hypothetical protein